MEHLSNDHEDHFNQHKNSHKQCNERDHPVVNMMESQWKLGQHDQNVPMEGKPLQNKCSHWKKYRNSKEQDCENHSLGSEQESCRKQPYHLSKVVLDRKIVTEFTRSISSTRTGKPVLLMDTEVSKYKHISMWVDQENLIYVR